MATKQVIRRHYFNQDAEEALKEFLRPGEELVHAFAPERGQNRTFFTRYNNKWYQYHFSCNGGSDNTWTFTELPVEYIQ